MSTTPSTAPTGNQVFALLGSNLTLTSLTFVFHPRTQQERWDYTRTFEVLVNLNSHSYAIRGHVHYSQSGTTSTAAPGRTWISGIQNWDTATPTWVVQRYSGSLSQTDRQAAVDAFNTRHSTHHALV